MSEHPCPIDGNPVSDATICRACGNALERDLGDIAAYVDELTTTLARQSVMGDRSGGGRSAEKPLPYNEGASEALDVLRSTLVACVRDIIRDDAWPEDNLKSMAAWLLTRVEDIRQHEAADEAVDEIRSALRLARRVVDRRPDRWYIGPCGHEECPQELHTRPGAINTVCPACGVLWDVSERRAWLLEAAEDQLVHASLMAAAVTRLGQHITAASIRGYAGRGRIVAHSIDHRGRPLYRVGDVLDLLAGEAARHAAKGA